MACRLYAAPKDFKLQPPPSCCCPHCSGSSNSSWQLLVPPPSGFRFLACPKKVEGAAWHSLWCWGSPYHEAPTKHGAAEEPMPEKMKVGRGHLHPCLWCSGRGECWCAKCNRGAAPMCLLCLGDRVPGAVESTRRTPDLC